MSMWKAEQYSYRVIWSEEDQEHVGLVDEFPSLSWLAEGQVAALEGIRDAVTEILDDLGDDAPVPLSERKYSGKFLVRTTPSVHRRLAEKAARSGRSLNAVANELLDNDRPSQETAAAVWAPIVVTAEHLRADVVERMLDAFRDNLDALGDNYDLSIPAHIVVERHPGDDEAAKPASRKARTSSSR